ncbi:MAG: hypothetical protein ACYTHJ_17645 [Planctomycetota bacterium]
MAKKRDKKAKGRPRSQGRPSKGQAANAASGQTGAAGPDGGERKRRKPKSWGQTHGRDLKFLAIFLVLIGLYYVATQTSAMSTRFFPWYLELNTQLSAVLLNVMGHDDVTAKGQSLIGQFRMQIARGCDGVDPSALFVAAVLASPVAFRRKVPAVVIGVLLLLALNVIRIVTLYFTGLYLPSMFDIAHLDVWQAAFIILALLFWAVWAHWISRRSVQRPHAA